MQKSEPFYRQSEEEEELEDEVRYFDSCDDAGSNLNQLSPDFNYKSFQSNQNGSTVKKEEKKEYPGPKKETKREKEEQEDSSDQFSNQYLKEEVKVKKEQTPFMSEQDQNQYEDEGQDEMESQPLSQDEEDDFENVSSSSISFSRRRGRNYGSEPHKKKPNALVKREPIEPQNFVREEYSEAILGQLKSIRKLLQDLTLRFTPVMPIVEPAEVKVQPIKSEPQKPKLEVKTEEERSSEKKERRRKRRDGEEPDRIIIK